MNSLLNILNNFINQSQTKDLKTSSYPKEWNDLSMKVSFGMGTPARIPWIGLRADGQEVSRGINPVYLASLSRVRLPKCIDFIRVY